MVCAKGASCIIRALLPVVPVITGLVLLTLTLYAVPSDKWLGSVATMVLLVVPVNKPIILGVAPKAPVASLNSTLNLLPALYVPVATYETLKVALAQSVVPDTAVTTIEGGAVTF